MNIEDIIDPHYATYGETGNAIWDFLHNRQQSNERILINLITTEFCNFKCAHCLFDHGPQLPTQYLTNEQLDLIEERMIEVCGMVEFEVNIIGGEPTTNFKHFERIYKRVMSWLENELIRSVEMSTNGHWLKNEKQTRKFFKIIGNHTPAWVYDDEFVLRIRISNSPFHEAFRPSHMQKTRELQNRLEGCWIESEFFYDDPEFNPLYKAIEFECIECGEIYDEDEECTTKDCENSYLSVIDFDAAFYNIPPRPNEDTAWIHVENQGYSVVPSGRGASQSNQNDHGDNYSGKCHDGSTVSYDPTGSNMDICCKGSNFKWGDMHTPIPIMLIASISYIQTERPACVSCKDQGELWATHSWEKLKTSLEADWETFIHLELDSFEYSEDVIDELRRESY